VSNTKHPIVTRSCTARRVQQGTSLLEGIAYLGIAATIIVGAAALLTNAFSAVRSNRSKEELSAISTGVKRLYMGQTTFPADAMNAQLVSAGVFPSTLTVAGADVVTNSWGGAVLVNGGVNGNFLVSYAAVPRNVCVELASGAGQWDSVSVDGGAALASPVSPAAAAGACTADANTLEWSIR
jgi:PilS N terminal